MITITEGTSFNLLKPTLHVPKEPLILKDSISLLAYLNQLTLSSDLIVDFETTGLDVLAPGFAVVGLGIACDRFPDGIYCPIDYSIQSDALMWTLGEFNLIAHNVSYDARVLEQYYRMNPKYTPMSRFPWKNDTLLMFKALANEGYAGQSWSLKSAQKSVLGWKETNEVELDAWLIDNKHTKTKGNPDKSKMCLAPHAILGKYCGLDAQSTYQLYKHFKTYEEQFPDLQVILEEEMMVLAKLEIEQFFHGMYIDQPLLCNRIVTVKAVMDALLLEFRTNSEATDWIKRYNENIVAEVEGKKPDQYTKTGKVASRYTKWVARVSEAKDVDHFNPNSKDQLAWLFYDCIFESGDMMERQDWRGNTNHTFEVRVNGNWHEVPGTLTGKRTVDKKILPILGKAGKLLSRYNELNKLLGYMTGMQESLDANGIHHTQLRLYGTLTGRCSGTGGVNIQQIPKAREYLDCLKPRPGHVFIQMDVDALEPVVLAELSEDEAMMNLYGPDAKPNDIYLYVGASIPALRDEVCKYGYDPLNPTAETIALTKKKAKRIRGICKVIHLSAGYGAGAGKIYQTLIQSGVEITLKEVKTLHKAYWALFGGVIDYQNKLKNEYAMNGGWFINGRGMPTSVASHLEKDILNRCIQSTGHFNLLTYLKHLEVLRKGNPRIKLTPIVCDFHDECIFEVPIDQAETALAMFRRTWSLTNEELGGIIPLSGEPEICHDFSAFKCEGGYKTDDIINEFGLEIT